MDVIDLRFCKVRQAYSVVNSLDKCDCKPRISNLIGNRLGNKEVKHADRWKA